MNRAYFLLIISWTLVSCSKTIDFSNPKEVIHEYYKLKAKNNLEIEYGFLANKCKEFAKLQDYLYYYSDRDSIVNSFDFLILKIEQLPIDPLFLELRLFEIQYLKITRDNKDTLKIIDYVTLYNENNNWEKENWKVIWTENLKNTGKEKFDSKMHQDAIDIYEIILKYNPFDGNAYRGIGWCQFRQGNYEHAIKNAQKSIVLNPKNEKNYNLLAGIYSNYNNEELAIENYKKAIEIAINEKDKFYMLSNLSLTYVKLSQFNEARKVLDKALSIDSTDAHTWYSKGQFYEEQNKSDSAIYCLKKATLLIPMVDYLQEQLYYALSKLLYNKAKSHSPINTNRDELLKDAKKQIIKALNFEPDNKEYRLLLDEINRVNTN